MNPENDDWQEGQEEIGIHTAEVDNNHNYEDDDDHDDNDYDNVMTVKMTNQAGRDSGMRSSEKTSRREEERRSAQARSTWRNQREVTLATGMGIIRKLNLQKNMVTRLQDALEGMSRS